MREKRVDTKERERESPIHFPFPFPDKVIVVVVSLFLPQTLTPKENESENEREIPSHAEMTARKNERKNIPRTGRTTDDDSRRSRVRDTVREKEMRTILPSIPRIII